MDTELRLLARKSFECWRIYATTKSSRRRSIRKAVYFYDVRLKQKALNSLLGICFEARRARLFYESLSTLPNGRAVFEAACDLHRKTILKRALRSWSLYVENSRRMRTFNERTSEIRDRLVLGKYIRNWKSISLEKKQNRELEEKALASHRDFVLRKSLRLWIEGHNRRLEKRKKWEETIMHYNRKLLIRVWHGWIKYCNVKIEKSNKIAETLKFYETKLLQRCFSALASNVSRAVARRALHEAAMNLYASRLSRRILIAWTNHHRRTVDIETKIETYSKKRENTLKRKALRQWRLYVWKKKCSRRKNTNATNHYRRKLAARAMAVTKKYVLYRKEKIASLHYLKAAAAQVSLSMQNLYIDRWRIALIRLAQERQKLRRAEEHWSASALKKYLHVWKLFSERYKARARLKKKLSEIGRCVLLNAYLNRWREKCAATGAIDETRRRAVDIYSRKIKSRLFKSWKRYTDDKTKNKKIGTDEATDFRNSAKQTTKSFASRSRSARKNSVEDFRILRTFFDAWLALICSKKDRKITGSRSRNTNGRAYVIPYSTRLVLPEYMKKRTMALRDGFYVENRRNDNFEFSEFARRYLPFVRSRSRSGDRSFSGSDTSDDLSAETYSLRSPVYARNEVESSLNSCL